MPKKKPPRKKPAPAPELVSKLLRFPPDWIARIDEARGEVSFSDYIRAAILEKMAADEVKTDDLSDPPAWGGSRK